MNSISAQQKKMSSHRQCFVKLLLTCEEGKLIQQQLLLKIHRLEGCD